MSAPRPRSVRLALAAMLASIVAACGFHLQGALQLPATMSRTQLETPDPDGASPPYAVEQRSNWLDPYGELRNTERGEAIHRAILELPPDFRELIALRHFAGLSYEAIALVKKMPLGTVKNKLCRARVVLTARLAGELT